MFVGVVWISIFISLFGGNAAKNDCTVAKHVVPEFTLEPKSLVAKESSSQTLHCRAKCSPNCTRLPIYWTKDDKNITEHQSQFRIHPNGDLSILSLDTSTTGRYRCIVPTIHLAVASQLADIKIAKLESVRVQPEIVQASLGGTARFQCVIKSVPKTRITDIVWYKNDQPLQDSSGRYYELPDGVLVIRNIGNQDRGTYACEARSKILDKEIISQKASLMVRSNPTSSVSSVIAVNKTVNEGESFAVECIGTGYPVPEVFISRTVNPSHVLRQGKGLAIWNRDWASVDDDGTYNCIAKQGRNIVKRIVILLRVNTKPDFTVIPSKSITRPVGGDAALKCEVTGKPKPLVQWYKNGKLISQEKQDSDGSLRFRSRQSDAGLYQCFVSNIAGSLSNRIYFSVRTRGSYSPPPRNVTARLVHSDPTSIIHVSWDIPVVSNKTEIQGYSVNYREKRTGGNVKNQVVFDKEATLKDLFGGTQYIIYVRLYTACGISDPSEHYEITTKEGRPRIPPARIRALNIGNQTLRLTWSPISRTYSNGRITFYSIYYGKIGSSVKKELHLPGNSTETVINSGLRDGEYCEIEMAARTVVGYGPKSNSVLVKIGSPADPVSGISFLNLRWISESSLRVEWGFLGNSPHIKGAKLTYLETASTYYWTNVKIKTFNTSVLRTDISGLKRTKMYRVSVSALSGGTERIPVTKISSCYHQLPPPITMPKATLSKPRNLKCTTQDESGLILSWEKPLTFNDLGGYSVFQVRGCDSRPILKAIVSDSKYVLSNLSPGKWYYIKVQANYKKSIIKKNLPELYSETIACKTKEIEPGMPTELRWVWSLSRSRVIVTWKPPISTNGLITEYEIKYCNRRDEVLPEKMRQCKRKMMRLPSPLKGLPHRIPLSLQAPARYEVKIAARNKIGGGPYAVLDIILKEAIGTGNPSTRRPVQPPAAHSTDSPKTGRYDDTELGIIVGCSVATGFVIIFVIVFLWKNPFRVRSPRNDITPHNGAPAGDFLYLQRLQELSRSREQSSTDTSVRSEKKRSNGHVASFRDKNDSLSSQPFIPKIPTVVELTGSSSGPPVCTCTCLLHGRFPHRGPPPIDRANQVSKATNTGDGDLTGLADLYSRCAKMLLQTIKKPSDKKSNTESSVSEERESAESGDSRKAMLPKSDDTSGGKEQKTTTRIILQRIQETTFQV